MSIEETGTLKLIERLSSAYGVSTQRALAESLAVPANNVSAWVKRNSVPGSAIIKCALDTGADLNWLVSGELEKASFIGVSEYVDGKNLLKEITANGGKAVVTRILEAYGFTMQKELCEHLGISSGTVSTWIKRNYFPGDVVVTCALNTEVSLRWLSLGVGPKNGETKQADNNYLIPKKILVAGKLTAHDSLIIDLGFINHPFIQPLFLVGSNGSWIIDQGITEISNGKWLLSIDEQFDIYDVTLLPGKKINILNNGSSFQCDSSEVVAAGKVMLSLQMNY